MKLFFLLLAFAPRLCLPQSAAKEFTEHDRSAAGVRAPRAASDVVSLRTLYQEAHTNALQSTVSNASPEDQNADLNRMSSNGNSPFSAQVLLAVGQAEHGGVIDVGNLPQNPVGHLLPARLVNRAADVQDELADSVFNRLRPHRTELKNMFTGKGFSFYQASGGCEGCFSLPNVAIARQLKGQRKNNLRGRYELWGHKRQSAKVEKRILKLQKRQDKFIRNSKGVNPKVMEGLDVSRRTTPLKVALKALVKTKHADPIKHVDVLHFKR